MNAQPKEPIRVGVSGISGRMGSLLARRLQQLPEYELVGGWRQKTTEPLEEIHLFASPEELVQASEVVVDFSQPQATQRLLEALIQHAPKPLVCGTTALSNSTEERIARLAEQVPVVRAANFSTGIALLNLLLPMIAAALKEPFDVEIVETHHRGKKDAPSGTARLLAQTLARARSQGETPVPIRVGREGTALSRGPEIVVHALRGGSVPGEHAVWFLGASESLLLQHRALSRDAFVEGALRALAWVVHQPPGLYGMEDVLQLSL